jgi:hypothetical protein
MACSKQTIELELTPHQDLKLVVEGAISDSLEVQEFRCHLSTGFGNTEMEPVADASVKLYTDEGIYSFSHVDSGLYRSDVAFSGIHGQLYSIEVIYDSTTYTAVTKMPSPIYINGVTVNSEINFFFKYIGIEIDLASEANQYIRYKLFTGTIDSILADTSWAEVPIPVYWITPVIAAPGQVVKLPAPDFYYDFEPGQLLRVELYSLSQDVGDYLLSLRDYVNKELPNSQFHNPPYYYSGDAYGLGYGYCFDEIEFEFLE